MGLFLDSLRKNWLKCAIFLFLFLVAAMAVTTAISKCISSGMSALTPGLIDLRATAGSSSAALPRWPSRINSVTSFRL